MREARSYHFDEKQSAEIRQFGWSPSTSTELTDLRFLFCCVRPEWSALSQVSLASQTRSQTGYVDPFSRETSAPREEAESCQTLAENMTALFQHVVSDGKR